MWSSRLTLPILLCIFLTACHTTTPVKKFNNTVTPRQQSKISVNKPSEKGVAICQSQLLALSKLNNELYLQKKKGFDNLISGASVYTTVREDIDIETKETLDALYKFKTQKLCNDIEQTLRQTLITQGENIK